MGSNIDALKRTFREGRHAEAVSLCESALARQPADRELKRLCANMHVMTRNFPRALELLRALRDPAREDGDLLFNIGNCEKELQDYAAASQTFESYTRTFPVDAGGWANLAECKFALDAFEEGARMAARAVQLDAGVAPELAKSRIARGDALQDAGQLQEAAAHYQAALTLLPGDGPTLKKVTMCLLESNRGPEAIQLCRDALAADPDNLTARLGAEWLLTQLVPLWHIPMMNEQERNQAFHDGLEAVVTPDKTVFEIGTGSGILAMMAARLGAKQVVTCEAVSLVAETASRIVARNGFQDRVTVLSRPSQEVQLGRDLSAKADILLHEVFSSELLGEHVLPAIEDAKARLLKPGGQVLPSAASIMVALVGGDALGRNFHVGESFGFDLHEFNAIQPRKRPLYREDLAPVLLSAPVEAFRFDFMKQSSFPAERKVLQVPVAQPGRCYGLIQWIRIELAAGIVYENHPSRPRAVSNWQHTIYGFDEPLQLQAGSVVQVRAWHDRARPWFALALQA